jgi:hypothetical protein
MSKKKLVWGQKTLQNNQSTLERINIKRLILHYKRHIKILEGMLKDE